MSSDLKESELVCSQCNCTTSFSQFLQTWDSKLVTRIASAGSTDGSNSRASPMAQMVKGEFPDDLFSSEQARQLRELFGFDPLA